MARTAPQRESPRWVLCLEVFTSLSGGNLRGGLRGGFSKIFISFPRVPFRVLDSTERSVPGQGVSRDCSSSCSVSGPGAEMQLRP